MGMYNFYSPWTSTTASKPLTLDAYITFFLVPFIAATVIGEDKNMDVEGGWETMQLEGDQGEDENSLRDDDPALDAVFASNAKRRNLNLAAVEGKKAKEKQVVREAKADKENTKPSVSLRLKIYFISLTYSDLDEKDEHPIDPNHVNETDHARLPPCEYS
jgi:hypothetical protein